MSKEFLAAVADRRTFYGLSKELTVPESRIKEILEQAIKHTPSAFNSQSTRVVLLLGDHHDRLWDLAKDALRRLVPAEQFSSSEHKINSFKNGYGTILYFEDMSIVKGLQEKYELYKDNFPIWSQQANGMHQFIIWTALVEEGLGVSLQHYTELIEAEVRKEWSIPDDWKLIAQMPFGKPTAAPEEKQYLPVENRIRVYR